MKRVSVGSWKTALARSERDAVTRDDIRGLELSAAFEQLGDEVKAWTERVRHETRVG